jgi:hypothetical protein
VKENVHTKNTSYDGTKNFEHECLTNKKKTTGEEEKRHGFGEIYRILSGIPFFEILKIFITGQIKENLNQVFSRYTRCK